MEGAAAVWAKAMYPTAEMGGLLARAGTLPYPELAAEVLGLYTEGVFSPDALRPRFGRAAGAGRDPRLDAAPFRAFRDALLAEALVWVMVPDVKPGAANELWIYFKNPKATPAEQPRFSRVV